MHNSTNLLFEQRHMKKWMDLRVLWEMKAISHRANAFLNLKGTIKLGCKFVRMAFCYGLLPIRLQLEEDLNTHLEFTLGSSLVVDLFHTVLSKL